MKVRFDRTEPTAHNIHTFYFIPEEPITYRAGQFTHLILPHAEPDKRGDKRWFSLSSSPSESELAITTKLTEETSSFKRTLQHLAHGTELSIAQPMGGFVLPDDTKQPLIFVAGGMGITPFRSMIKWLADTNERRNIHLIYALTHIDELCFAKLFMSYGLKLTLVVRQPQPDWKGETGTLNAERIVALSGQAINTTRIYLSGPEPMIQRLSNELKTLGQDSHLMLTDFFPGYLEV